MRLRRRFTQPRRKIENIDLTEIIIDGQSAHNYWIEQTGKVEINGQNLYNTLLELIDSTDYQFAQEGNEDNDGGKEKLLDSVFRAFKKEAEFKMIEKYDLTEKINEAKEQKYGLLEPSFEIQEDQGKELLPRSKD